jgi:hypothetical protein
VNSDRRGYLNVPYAVEFWGKIDGLFESPADSANCILHKISEVVVVCSRILIPQKAIEIRKHAIVNSIAISLIAIVIKDAEHTEWKRKIVQILSLDPERRRHVIKILLDHAKKLQMGPETVLLTKWLEKDPERGPVNEPLSEPVSNSLPT